MGTVTFLGTSDEVSVCDCCGRKDLKSTVALSFDGGEPTYYGVVCAARALKLDAKAVRSETRKADDAKAAAERAVRDEARRAEQAPWFKFLGERGQGGDVFRQIESLGGYVKARELFKAARVAA